MTEDRTTPYEGLFLFPQAQMGDLQAAVDHLTDVLGRVDAEVISLRKWDERRLAFEIKGNKRGVYFLVYFRAPADALRKIERFCNLSELLLRFMITRADHLTQEQLEAADGRAELADEITLRAKEAPAASEGESGSETPEGGEPITVETESVSKDPAAT